MGQTKQGAKKALETMRKRYGDDWLKERARRAGQANKKGGFKKGSKQARKAGLEGARKRWQEN